MRQVVDGDRALDWQLAVTNGDVVASLHQHGGDSIWFSTEDRPNRKRELSEFGLSRLEVLQRYIRHSGTDATVQQLEVRTRMLEADLADNTHEVCV